MRILIAGAAGFIGCHLARRCLQRGHQVIGVDNFCTGHRDNIAWLNEPSPRPAGADFTFVEHDVTRELDLAGPLDLVCDLACPASPVDFAPLALDIMRVCSQGVWNLLELARRRGARFLHTSTSEVYGDPDVHPQVESYWGRVNPIGPRSVYDEGKRYAEALITAYHRKHDLPVRLARIFNTYGPRMRLDDGRVVTNFICQALAGRPLTVYGDGSQTRSFCYVDDQVEGLLRLADCDYAAPVNIGNPDEIPIGELAREIIELTGSSSPLQFKPLPGDDPRVRRPDISLARRVLGWSPAVGRREGLQRTVEFCKAKLSRA
ncbi:MAG: UDP-glucose 4-epimerase [Planctomycetes bacterium ADurb.Bin126]|nr:MAG: UDP-glucose 4-epimerase [Planctomycetes bacterium ADurb.Bin126]HQL74913.1 SDR family oxidoreductase [Phycisphaerae bacterium]